MQMATKNKRSHRNEADHSKIVTAIITALSSVIYLPNYLNQLRGFLNKSRETILDLNNPFNVQYLEHVVYATKDNTLMNVNLFDVGCQVVATLPKVQFVNIPAINRITLQYNIYIITETNHTITTVNLNCTFTHVIIP